jgi:hypothetical protein
MALIMKIFLNWPGLLLFQRREPQFCPATILLLTLFAALPVLFRIGASMLLALLLDPRFSGTLGLFRLALPFALPLAVLTRLLQIRRLDDCAEGVVDVRAPVPRANEEHLFLMQAPLAIVTHIVARKASSQGLDYSCATGATMIQSLLQTAPSTIPDLICFCAFLNDLAAACTGNIHWWMPVRG